MRLQLSQINLSQIKPLQKLIHKTLPEARIEPIMLPGCGGIALALINADFPPEPLAGDILQAVIRDPAYWAFCWGSGLALAQFLYRHPEWTRRRSVVDLGSGSGVVAIAAAATGATRVIACDDSPDALIATRANAALNGVTIETCARLENLPRDNDLLLMADVLYDASNFALLQRAGEYATQVIVADSRITELPDPSYRELSRFDASTYPNLGEFDEFRTVRLFHRA